MCPTIFADIDPMNAAGSVGGVIGIVSAVWFVVRQFLKDRSDSKQAEKKADDEAQKSKKIDTIAELKSLLDTLRTDFDAYKKESKAELQETRKNLEASETRSHECDRRSDRMSAHIFYLEDAIRRGVKDFRSWSEVDAGSGNHAAISPREAK
jgi:hypothetical protein